MNSEERNYMANAEAGGEKTCAPPMLARAVAACRDEQFFGMKLRAPLYATRRARDHRRRRRLELQVGRDGVDERVPHSPPLSDNANEQVGVRSNSCGEHTIHSLLLSMVRAPTKEKVAGLQPKESY